MDVELQPFGREDFDRLIEWVDSPELCMIWSGISLTYPLDYAQLERYLETGRSPQAVRRIYRVAQRGGPVVGHIELNGIDLVSRAATVSRVLVGKPYRGQGVASQMVRQVLQVGFDQLGLHRIDLVVFDFNQAAIRVYEKCGFQLEGKLRDHRRMGETYWTNRIMSILEDEWRARRAGQA